MSAVTRDALRLPRIRRRSSPDGLDRLRRRDLADFLRTEMRHHDATKALLRDALAAAVEAQETATKRVDAAVQQLTGAAEAHRLDALHLAKGSAEQRIHYAVAHTLLDIARDLERSTG